MLVPTTALAFDITLAYLLFFIARPYISLAAPKAKLPLMLAALGPTLAALNMLVGYRLFAEIGPMGFTLLHLASSGLLWGGLGLAVFMVMNAPEGGVAATFQRFSVPSLMAAGGVGLGVIHVATSFLRLHIIPLPGVAILTVGVGLTFAGLVSLMNAAWPARNTLPPPMLQHRITDRGTLFFPGFIGFFATSFLLLSIFGRSPDVYDPIMSESGIPVSRVADLACLDVLLVAWGYYILRIFPFFWVLERRPEAVVWVFIKETRIIRGAARWTVWAANVGVDSGQILTLPTGASNFDAEQVCVTIGRLCPGAAQGYNEAMRDQFARDPAGLRRIG